MMRRFLNSPSLSLLALLALAAWPLWRAGYPFLGDGLIHLYRLVEFDSLLRNGVWFPRWASDLCYGYGCPLFNFYPPLTYYAGAAFHALGLSYAHSLLMVYTLALALAIAGAYALAKEIWERGPSALFAAAAYGLAPYLYFNALARGALPELLGLGLLPWTLWAYVRLARRPANDTLLAASLAYATLILTHLLTALLAAPLMFAFALIGKMAQGTGHRAQGTGRKAFGLLPSAFCLSLALSAYFLLPAVLETNAVKISQLTTPGDLDFHNNFLQLTQLLAWPKPFDAKLVFVSLPPSLSLIALAFAILGLALRFRRASLSILDFGFWILGFALCLLTLPFTARLWELLPIANLIQFPWRLVGPASLLLALLAALAVSSFELGVSSLKFEVWTLKFEFWPLGFGIFLLWLFSLSWTFAPPFSTPAAPTVRDLTPYELATGQLGATSTGEFVPATVAELPAPATARLASLPAGVALIEQSATVLSVSATVNASAPATLTFNIFNFPGWQAAVDGQPAPVAPSAPHGLLTVPVPSGQHTVAVRFTSTPLRRVAELISIVAAVAVVMLKIKDWRLKAVSGFSDECHAERSEASRLNIETLRFSRGSSTGFAQGDNLYFSIFLFALLCLRILFIDGRETLFARTRFDGATVSGVQRALDVNFDNQLILIGADNWPASLAANHHLPLTLYWRAQNLPAADYAASVQVVDALGNLFGQSDSQHPGRVPTSRWRLDQYAQDEHSLTLLPGTPPGTYTLTVSVYQPGGSGLSVLDENLIPQGQAFVLGTLTVTRATRPPEKMDAAQTLNLSFGDATLIGATFGTTAPQAGDELRATLFWREAQSSSLQPSILQLGLYASDGSLLREQSYPYIGGAEVIRQPVRFRIPARAPAGPAQLRLTWTGHAQPIATLDIQVPLRSFIAPAITFPRGDDFGSSIKLLGYDFTPEGITLHWQATAEMDTSYTAFVHALNAEGRVSAQSDAVPMNGARPTTGWLTGEVITDPHALSLSGAAQIEIGLYDPQTNARLGVIVIAP